MAFSDYLESAVLDHIFRSVTYTPPETVYMALFTTLPGDGGTDGEEVTGGSYARQAVTFAAAVEGAVSNDVNLTFLNMPETEVVGGGFYDAPTGGNYLCGGPIAPRAVPEGEDLIVAVGDLTVGLG